MSEDKLEKEIEEYAKLGASDKKIDVAGLMINALQKHERNLIPVKEKRIAYLVSLALPPLGFIYAIKFYLSDKDDGSQAALFCTLLTVFSLIISFFLVKTMLSGAGTSLDQIQYLNETY
ncbi:MAG: hypothetical protein A3C49_03625 [Candidatus Doudnabacteria bacterium RIFCSPHIGHO2_02_FULL_42_25]|uniref:Uncharacterized protein n=1 Tax=Candidatus Doudnabacteria bacterium RIFCSPHIGHO2_01_FULL_41_86 TaxID=1817821 RepID=A0A1F5N8E5_9BACT|nr:MAG: hypothetical protein A2717_04605 [Candidatus Doudnabacteria bacterium RIFCSPHIGHO2_01_FULL_41_86]OGE75893.1 MAG: hypothetical protein A3K07_04200 [Candidatus Doudnabacteria bacterium RIFCSPHIGHO2_01_43_10]OGE86267.1 MAG: hypothetical protein A3E28_03960 [Candidatus Doudnabacteria bacterium RIFCSPHIGHO2_12_FULL_42_22]OGE87115.1 MAG: hypothetical protein A3C49_03625 [Candidatus Doudnabacteria bacterium RIFCSPHIGHO2_02_FULL_42_25]OGE92255.1 MAG: hypothetical protein A2895_04310 [Candidatus